MSQEVNLKPKDENFVNPFKAENIEQSKVRHKK